MTDEHEAVKRGLIRRENTIFATNHNLNNASNFLALIANHTDIEPDIRSLAMEYSLAVQRAHEMVAALHENVRFVALDEE